MLFLDGKKHWQYLTNKRTGESLAPKTLKEKFGGLNTMKNSLGVDTPPALERSFKAGTKLKTDLLTDLEMESISLEELLSLAEDIHVKTREASQNTEFDMQEFLVIDKVLQIIQGKLLNKTSKLTETDKRIKRDTKKLEEELENDPTDINEQI